MKSVDVPVRRGLDSKQRLLNFFSAKRHKNVVLRVVDLLDMRNEDLAVLLRYIAAVALFDPAKTREMVVQEVDRGLAQENAWRKQWLTRNFPSGWVVLSIDALLEPLDLVGVERLQQALYEYRNVRYSKGEPNRIETCPACEKGRTPNGRKCERCDGAGIEMTFLEMSSDEVRLAEAGQ